jgi:hypothetical protein
MKMVVLFDKGRPTSWMETVRGGGFLFSTTRTDTKQSILQLLRMPSTTPAMKTEQLG